MTTTTRPRRPRNLGPAKINPDLLSLVVPIDWLKPDPDNANEHPEENLAAIAASLEDHGQQKAIVVLDDGTVVAGNGTLEAAKRLGWRGLAAVIFPDRATADDFAVRDNQTNRLSRFNAKLGDKLKAIAAGGVDLGRVGFNADALKAIGATVRRETLASLPEPRPEHDAAPPPAEDVLHSVPGTIYELGPHRILCGDSTDREQVARLMGGRLAAVVITDPPYGVDYEGGNRLRGKEVEGDETPDLYPHACRMAREFSDDEAPVYLWHGGVKTRNAVCDAYTAAGYDARSEIVWNKSIAQFGQYSAQYKQKHEPALYLVRRGKPPRWYGPTNEVTVWDCARPVVNEFHPTQKPVELGARMLRNSSAEGDLVLDLFLGSGSTLIAASLMGRTCYGVERSRAYCDVIRKRWTVHAREQGMDPGPGALE